VQANRDDQDEIADIGAARVPYTAFSGFCMGTADVVPGVSGGTMAVALGIYGQLLAAINSVASRGALRALRGMRVRELLAVVHWRFLASLAAGLAVGIGIMVKVVGLPEMVTATAPERPAVYAIFFGMVIASCVSMGRTIKEWKPVRIASLVVGTVVGFVVVNLVPVQTPDHPLFIFLCGVIAICAMLLPGISGSFLLLILGKYSHVLGAVGRFDLAVLVPFALGCLTGLLSFSRVLSWLLRRWYQTVLAGLIGLLLGSLWRIWPYQRIEEVVVDGKSRVIGATAHLPETFDVKLVALFLAGIALVQLIEWYARRRSTVEARIADAATARPVDAQERGESPPG
jgi:putative membrane protein